MKIHWFDDEQKQDIKKVYKFYYGDDVLPCILCDTDDCQMKDDLHGFCKFDLSKAEREVKKRYERAYTGFPDSVQCYSVLYKQFHPNVQSQRYPNFRASYVQLDIRDNLLKRFNWSDFLCDKQKCGVIL